MSIDFTNKSYQNQLDSDLISSISLSMFAFLSAITIRGIEGPHEKSSYTNKIIVLLLIFLSISFSIVGIVKYTTEFFDDLRGKYRYQFNYFTAIFYTILVSILLIVELLFARETWYYLL